VQLGEDYARPWWDLTFGRPPISSLGVLERMETVDRVVPALRECGIQPLHIIPFLDTNQWRVLTKGESLLEWWIARVWMIFFTTAMELGHKKDWEILATVLDVGYSPLQCLGEDSIMKNPRDIFIWREDDCLVGHAEVHEYLTEAVARFVRCDPAWKEEISRKNRNLVPTWVFSAPLFMSGVGPGDYGRMNLHDARMRNLTLAFSLQSFVG